VEKAEILRDSLISAVLEGKFVAVCDGIEEIKGVSLENVPKVNYQPKGPHPVGSFEVKQCFKIRTWFISDPDLGAQGAFGFYLEFSPYEKGRFERFDPSSGKRHFGR